MISREGVVYFTADELKCKGTGLLALAPLFPENLLELRLAFGKPMTPISCCRSTEHNAREGGAKDSFHICDVNRGTEANPIIGSCAIDIATPTPAYRTELVKLALAKGWSVGIKRSMVHLDRRIDLGAKRYPQVVFVY